MADAVEGEYLTADECVLADCAEAINAACDKAKADYSDYLAAVGPRLREARSVFSRRGRPVEGDGRETWPQWLARNTTFSRREADRAISFSERMDKLIRRNSAELIPANEGQWEALRSVEDEKLQAALESASEIASQRGRPVTAAIIREAAKPYRTVSRADDVPIPDGQYETIVIDPPWEMERIELDLRQNQSEFDYRTMPEEELAKLELPAADSCHLWCWTTHKHLPMAQRLIEAWGFRYVCMFVWHKPGGMQPVKLPQYNCEFAVYARRGSPEFVDTKAFKVCFEAPRGAHSEKPEAFYDVVRRVTRGPRIDMFNRRKIDGFDTWGDEAQ